MVAEVTPGSPLAVTCCTKLAPKVIAQLEHVRFSLLASHTTQSSLRTSSEQPASSSELLIDSLDLLSDILSRFETTVRTNTSLQTSSLKAITPLLSNPRPALRKRSVSTLGKPTFSILRDLAHLGPWIKQRPSSRPLTRPPSSTRSSLPPSSSSSRVPISSSSRLPSRSSPLLLGPCSFSQSAVAAELIPLGVDRTAPIKMGKKTKDLVPLIIATLDKDDDELKEVALQSLEALVLKCPTEVAPFFTQIVESATSLLKHDPVSDSAR